MGLTQAAASVIVPRVVTSDGIGARIKEAREALQMRQVQLAADTGLALNTIRNYELNLTAQSIENLRLIADALDVDVLWLIDGDRVGEVA
jgi:transcriptional regulator with XRE-family HTH domain